jgi:hypothetical protein
MTFTQAQKVFCVKKYFKKNSYKYAITKFRETYDHNKFPSKTDIYRWKTKFETMGTINNMRMKYPQSKTGRKFSARSPDNVRAVRDSVGRSPKKSIRRRSQDLGLTRMAVQRILIKDLHLYPYWIQIKHKLTPADKEKRVIMCNWFADKIEEEPDFLDTSWFSDEAHFLLSGHVNSKNNVFWGTEPPAEVLQRPLHSLKCTAWVAISKHGIIGPFWFENANQEPVTVRKENYIEVLNKFWRALGLLSRGRGRNRVQRDIQWFQQDGAPPHTANITLDWLDHKFPDRLISRKREPEWSPHSPDLNPPDFYLWGFLKDNVYRNNPQTIPELKEAITQEINAITKEECIKVIDNFARRTQVCLQQNGGHLEHIL